MSESANTPPGTVKRNAGKKSTWSEIWSVIQTPSPTRFMLGVSAISRFNAGILIPVLPLYFLQKGFSFLELGSLFSVVALGTVFFQLFAGRYAAFLARPVVLAPLLLASAVMTPLYLWTETLPQFALITILNAVAGAIAGPGFKVLIASVATPDARAFMYANFGVVSGFSYAGGVMMGGFLLGIGYEVVFFAASAFALLVFLVMLRLMWQRFIKQKILVHADRRGTSNAASPSWTVEALRVELASAQGRLIRARNRLQSHVPVPAQSMRNIRLASIHLFMFGSAVVIYPVYFPRYLITLGLPIGWVGAVVAASWITFGLAQPIGAKYADRTGYHRPIIGVSLAAMALLNFAMASTSLWWVISAWVLLGVADGIGRPVADALFVEGVPPSARGSVFGWTMAAETIARVVAPLALAYAIMGGGVGIGILWVANILWLSILPIIFFQKLPGPTKISASHTPASEVSA